MKDTLRRVSVRPMERFILRTSVDQSRIVTINQPIHLTEKEINILSKRNYIITDIPSDITQEDIDAIKQNQKGNIWI